MANPQPGTSIGRTLGFLAALLLVAAALAWLVDRASIAMGGRGVAVCALSRGIDGDLFAAAGLALFALGLVAIAATAGRSRAGALGMALGVLLAIAPDLAGRTSDIGPACGATPAPTAPAPMPAPKPNGPVIIPDVS